MKKWKCIRVVSVLVSVLGVGLMGSVGWAGTLEPPAAAVDGNGNPVATGDLHSWGKKLNAANGIVDKLNTGCFSERFTCIFPNENGLYTAVQDNETGLVWERGPLSLTTDWTQAALVCPGRIIGGRGGWHSPTLSELTTLLDPAVANAPKLPQGHPFLNVTANSLFGTTESYTSQTGQNIFVALRFGTSPDFQGFGLFANTVGVGPNNSEVRVWCVRGGQSENRLDSRDFVSGP